MLAFYTTKYECATLPMCDLNNSLEFDCASLHCFMFLYNLSSAINGQCKPNCKITQYSGKQIYEEKSDTIAIRYSNLAPALTIVHKEGVSNLWCGWINWFYWWHIGNFHWLFLFKHHFKLCSLHTNTFCKSCIEIFLQFFWMKK